MFEKAKQNRVFEDVVNQIKNAVLKGEFKAGDLLPAERELTETFSVSRGTLREALRVCEQMGLIEIKLGAGGGAVIRGPSTEKVSESLDLLIRHQSVSLDHLAEFRENVEGQAAFLAALRVNEDEIQSLKDLLKEAKIHLDKGPSSWDAFIDVDQRFHIHVAHLSKNPVFELVLTSVHANIHRYYNRFHPKTADQLTENYQDLEIIVGAIEKRQAQKACDVAMAHVKRFNRHMVKEARRKQKE